MGKAVRIIRAAVLAGGIALAGVAGWLAVAPPELLRVGTGYAAKIVCSNLFVAGREPAEVLRVDVQAPGNPLLRFLRLRVDRDQGQVTAYMFGAFAPSTAIHRPGFGCTSVPDGDLRTARAVPMPAASPSVAAAPADPAAVWPAGAAPPPTDPGIAAILADPQLTGPGARATLVIRDGRLLGEAYGPGFGPDTPLIGWSMTKTVTAALVAMRVGAGAMTMERDHLLSGWAGDGRAAITLAQLLGMESGLAFNENYGTVSDVTRMLFLEADQPGFVASRPLADPPGSRFVYSTGTSVLLARLMMDSLQDPAQALAFPRTALFQPLSMDSAVMETDARGTLSGGSYLYATARDWAKFAQLLLQDGVWNGKRLLPEGAAARMQTPTASSGGVYTAGQMWKVGTDRPDAGSGLPGDTVWMRGHDGQVIAIIPSRRLIVLRMGLTPSRLGYQPQPLVRALLDAVEP